MTKEEIIEELERIEWQMRELESEHDMFAEMLADLEEQE